MLSVNRKPQSELLYAIASASNAYEDQQLSAEDFYV